MKVVHAASWRFFCAKVAPQPQNHSGHFKGPEIPKKTPASPRSPEIPPEKKGEKRAASAKRTAENSSKKIKKKHWTFFGVNVFPRNLP